MSAHALAPTVVGVPLALVGCGGERTDGGSSAGTANTSVAGAAAHTFAAGSANVSVVFEHTSTDPLWGYEAGERGNSYEGIADFGRRRVALEDEHRKVIVAGETLYFRDGYEQDRRWRTYELDRESEHGVTSLALGRVDVARLVEAFATLENVSFTPIGEESVRGSRSTHYHAIVQSESLARALVPGIPYTKLAKVEGSVPPSTRSVVEAWVDDEGLLRKAAYDLDVFRSLLGGERTIVELYDFGVEVDVEPPAADETVVGG